MRRSIVVTGNKLAVLGVLIIAIVLAAAAALSHHVRAAEINAAAQSVTNDAGQVTAGELAQWIVEKRQDYQLIDLRDPWQFDDYHIPTAINIPFAQLFRSEARLDKSKKIVVYGLGAGHAAQVQVLLAMKGYRIYALNDGIIAWWDEVMTPSSIRSANPQSSGYQQARQLREYFTTGGRASEPPAAFTTPPVQEPAPVMPAAKPSSPKPATKVKPAAKPASKPAEKPPKDKDKDRLKLGAGCS